MAFLSRLFTGFKRGAVLLASSDDIPADSLRVVRNCRIDRVLGTIASRPGMRALSSALGGSIQWMGKLFGVSVDLSYVQISATLSRLADDWTGALTTLHSATGTTPVSSAIMPDGESTPVPYAYFASSAGPLLKDNGTTVSVWGIAPPTAVPQTVALATDLSTTIDDAESAATWTGTALSAGPANDATNKIVGTNSQSFSIAANTLATLGVGTLGGGTGFLNLDTLTSGDSTVKADDYIAFWIRFDRPDFVSYLQVDVDLDTQTLANAFVTNYYSAFLDGSKLNQGGGNWTHVQVRKSEFQRFGTNASVSWAVAKCFRVRILTLTTGAVSGNIDDVKLRGGCDMEGDISYTVCYRNSTTKGRGNPYRDSSEVIQWTTPLTTDRQRITVTLTNVAQGGANHPGDGQIDKLWLFRRGSQFTEGVRVVELADGTTTYTDGICDATLLLDPIVLEADNDPPPTALTVVFGPGGFNRLFGLTDGYRLRYSKQWELDENRAENWPSTFDVGIGNGSMRAVGGIATDTQVLVFDQVQAYQVVGSGADTLLPVPIPNSRGLVGPQALCAGDGRVFLVATGADGLYQQVGLQQQKLTGDIDPFFAGIAIDGNPALGRTTAQLENIRLAWHNDPAGAFVVMLYSGGRLTVKKGVDGQYTTCLFDDGPVLMGSVLTDPEDRLLLLGGADGIVYSAEIGTLYADNSAAITCQVRTKSDDAGQPARFKRVSQVVVEAGTDSTDVTPTVYYNRSAASEVLATVSGSASTDQYYLPVRDPDARVHDVALDLAWSGTTLVTVSLVGFDASLSGEQFARFDSDTLSFPLVVQVKWIDLDGDFPANVTLTYLVDNRVLTYTVLATDGQERFRVRLEAGVRGTVHQVRLSSASTFELFHVGVWAQPLGSDVGYKEQLIFTSQTAAQRSATSVALALGALGKE